MARHRLPARWRSVVGGALTAVLTGLGAWYVFGSTTANAGSISGDLYRDPAGLVNQWVATNPDDPRVSRIRDRIARRPQARWYTSYNPGLIRDSVAAYVKAANEAGDIPQLVLYALPNRDCGGASEGGAPDLGSYQKWVENAAAGMGDKLAIVVLEPNSLALQTCLTAGESAARDEALANATRAIKRANRRAKVYLDAGHSAWNPADEAARRLVAAGITRYADGFFTNVGNFRTDESEVAFGEKILAALDDPRLHQVIDVSRNGNGPLGSEWCDPAGRRTGRQPTTNTGKATVDAFLWVKRPGEADGCRGSAGRFYPDLAYELTGGRPISVDPRARPGMPTSTPAQAPVASASASAPVAARSTAGTSGATPTTTGATSGVSRCTVKYRIDSQWADGFTATLIVLNEGPDVINGWTLSFSFAGDQAITNLWNGAYTQNGQQVSVRSAPYNNTILPGGDGQVLGFQARYSGTNDTVSAFVLNGVQCSIG